MNIYVYHFFQLIQLEPCSDRGFDFCLNKLFQNLSFFLLNPDVNVWAWKNFNIFFFQKLLKKNYSKNVNIIWKHMWKWLKMTGSCV